MVDSSAQPAFLNLLDPRVCLYSEDVRRAREAHWYAYGSPADYVALRYREVAALLREPRLRDSTYQWLSNCGISAGPLVDWWNSFMLNLEGEEHARIRRLVSKAFTPPAIERLRPFMRMAATRLLDALTERDACDFVEAFADPYPFEVISELLGIPEEHRTGFRGWANDLGFAFGMEVAPHQERIESAVSALLGCVDELLAQRRRRPGSDLLSGLLAVQDGGDRLTSHELRMLIVSLVFAGNDTTRHQLALAMYAFLQHPAQWTLLAERPELAVAAAEEVFRVYPVVPGVGRTALEDFEFSGLSMPAGTNAYLLISAANTDPAAFGPECGFDIAAPARQRILSFGGGVHHCLGNWLARAELQEALPLLAARLQNPELTAEPTWRTLGITGPKMLPIRFTPSSAAPTLQQIDVKPPNVASLPSQPR